MTPSEGLLARQATLNIASPKKVCIVGVGGVGSWLALDLALVGVDEIALVDDDIVEESNLNRTPFTYSQIGMLKVDAMAELIAERRPECKVYPFPFRSEGLGDWTEFATNDAMLIDCRDSTEPLEVPGTYPCTIVGGYDGTSITLHTNPTPNVIFGDAVVRYRIVPSFVGAPALIAAIMASYIVLPKMRSAQEHVMTFDMVDLINIIDRS